MSSADEEPHSDSFFLTPHQQSLLFAALNANKPQAQAQATANPVSLSPSSFKNSPVNGAGGATGYQQSPFLDNYDYEFGDDSNFDFSLVGSEQGAMIGDMPSTSDKSDSPDDDLHEKRSHPDDDEDGLESDPKRRESSEKIPKKPGRKPLTSEPTSVSFYPSLAGYEMDANRCNRNARPKTALPRGPLEKERKSTSRI